MPARHCLLIWCIGIKVGPRKFNPDRDVPVWHFLLSWTTSTEVAKMIWKPCVHIVKRSALSMGNDERKEETYLYLWTISAPVYIVCIYRVLVLIIALASLLMSIEENCSLDVVMCMPCSRAGQELHKIYLHLWTRLFCNDTMWQGSTGHFRDNLCGFKMNVDLWRGYKAAHTLK